MTSKLKRKSLDNHKSAALTLLVKAISKVFLGKEVSKGSQLFPCSLVRFMFDMFKTAEHALIWDTVSVSYAQISTQVLHK